MSEHLQPGFKVKHEGMNQGTKQSGPAVGVWVGVCKGSGREGTLSRLPPARGFVFAPDKRRGEWVPLLSPG